ncbi:MAG TPA: hypothetical protein VGC58_00775, partial [Candidatus Paceibacterota bacterium]
GGSEEILELATRERFAGNMKAAAQALVKSDWRIPASEMRAKALQCYRRDFKPRTEYLEEVEHLWWYAPLRDLGIPFERYDDDRNSGDPSIPSAVLRDLHGRKMEFPLFVHDKVVVDWGVHGDQPASTGVIILPTSIRYLALADGHRFDFDK